MGLNDMNKQLKTVLQYFNDELGRAGWDVIDFSEMFAAGISVHPEGIASRKNEKVVLEVHLCLSECELRLFILERETDQMIRLVLIFKEDICGILSCLISEQDHIDKNTFPQFLFHSSQLAERIWFVDHEGTRFQLEFPL